MGKFFEKLVEKAHSKPKSIWHKTFFWLLMLFDNVFVKKRTTKEKTYLSFKFCFDSMKYKCMVFDTREIDKEIYFQPELFCPKSIIETPKQCVK